MSYDPRNIYELNSVVNHMADNVNTVANRNETFFKRMAFLANENSEAAFLTKLHTAFSNYEGAFSYADNYADVQSNVAFTYT